MPKIIEQTVYTFEELSDDAKDTVRQDYAAGLDSSWYDFTYEDFKTVTTHMHIRLDTNPVKLHGGGTREEPCISFSGFSSQGDGASFEGDYLIDLPGECLKVIQESMPEDAVLHTIATELDKLTAQFLLEFPLPPDCEGGRRVSIGLDRGNYVHDGMMSVSYDLGDVVQGVEEWNESADKRARAFEDAVLEQARALARWLYTQLETAYNYELSDENLVQTLDGNYYAEDGTRVTNA
jgi:hypothetical protein